ncbi:MAG: twin-arginine translocase subunit TatB [Saccharospirillaceae bacterium]|nr:Sec-independent protein translocase protein TatB [Pseudomonadales bacterium]NRB79379.1 twin-arginine translocase subunit TatB [Saccharospirillaceae bacterium]
MFNMSFIEMFVVFTIALVVLGPDRLPVAARELGKNIGKVKRFFNNMQRQIDQEIRLEELNRKVMAQLDETQKFIDEQKAKIAETEAIEHEAETVVLEKPDPQPKNNDQVNS